MNLSERAIKYLKTLVRDKNWSSNEEETRSFLLNQNINSVDEFLKFQTLYSGYELTITNDPGHSFSAFLFSNEQVQKNDTIELERAENRFLINCGEHNTAQFIFYLTDKGEICTIDSLNMLNILHSSFEKYVEEYALKNEIHNWDSNPYYYEVIKEKELVDFMNNDFLLIEECSDKYSTWWRNKNLIAVKGVWLDRHESYFHIYGKKRKECDNLINTLKVKEIIK